MPKKKLFIFLFILSFTCNGFAQNLPHDIEVKKIWDKAEHNAFTDLIRFKNCYYCSFREGAGHVFGKDGVVRILKSSDGENWTDIALLDKQGFDLRDPKLSVTPDGRIMVIMGGSMYENGKLLGRKPHVSFSDRTGENFSAPEKINIDSEIVSWSDWTWRVTWFKKIGYTVDYQIGPEEGKNPTILYLLKTKDGINYEKVSEIELDGFPNETTLRFDKKGTLFALIRRELEDKMGVLALSKPPYTSWNYIKLNFRLGGPNFIFDKDEKLIVGSRAYEDGTHTGLFVGDKSGNLKKVLRLPSGGDTSYPGLVLEKDKLMVSYYSSHEGKSAIYIAKIPLAYLKNTEK